MSNFSAKPKVSEMWIGIEEQGTNNILYLQFRETDTISDVLNVLSKEYNMEGRIYHMNFINVRKSDVLSTFKEDLKTNNFKFSSLKNNDQKNDKGTK